MTLVASTWQVTGLFVLQVLSGYFSSSETAFFSLGRGQVPASGELHALGDREIEVPDATPRRVLKVRVRRETGDSG